VHDQAATKLKVEDPGISRNWKSRAELTVKS
jgi:hypothetical protein